jgi:leucyl/phenylalanyl-tRNA--protein transferase
MVPWLDPRLPPQFPNTREALDEPNGLLAAGGQLSPDWLLLAYRHGIFPWFNEGEPILWWSPAPRTVLLPGQFYINRSFRKFLNRSKYRITRNRRFNEVMQACAEPRLGQPGTWISSSMIRAYSELHQQGYAQSWECWDEDDVMVGGLYGVSLGDVFFGESMFSRADYASRCCLKALVDTGDYQLIDCQMKTEHLTRLGAEEVSRERFEELLRSHIGEQV